MLKSLREIRVERSEKTRLRGKNLILCPSHIAELISNFEFKLVRKETEGSDDCFHKLSSFTQLLLKKWLTPSLFMRSCWKLASEWREKHVNLDLQQHILLHSCFLFCDIKHWACWLERAAHKNVEILRVQESGKLDERLPKGELMKLCVLVDERELSEERNEGAIRQRLQEYLSLNGVCNLVVLLSDKFHQTFHEVLRFIHKSQDFESVKVHCL
jgi:hypothetical protein